MTNVYQVLLDLVKNWLNNVSLIVNWFNTPLYSGGFTPISLLTFGGLSILSGILIVKLIL